VPYSKVDEAIKIANWYALRLKKSTMNNTKNLCGTMYSINRTLSFRDTASETVRTLLVYGYILEPPTGEPHDGEFEFR